MQTVGIRQLKNRLSEYVRLVRAGEEILITSHGEVVAELRPPEASGDAATPAGLRELVRRGMAHGLVRNDPSRYRSYPRALAKATSRELLDWGRGDR